MTLGEQLTDYVHAAFSGLWIQTTEAEEAEREITRHAVERGWKLAVWDIAQGIRFPSAKDKAAAAADAHDPVAALRALPALADKDGTALKRSRYARGLQPGRQVGGHRQHRSDGAGVGCAKRPARHRTSEAQRSG